MSSFLEVPVSVIVPCYCCATTIERAVDSVVNQSYRPHELILVDDASKDGTIEKLKSLREQYGAWIRIVVLSTNVGAASARNMGWYLASQPYIAFLDADDSWHPKKLEIQYQYMCNHSDIAISGHQYITVLTDKADFSVWSIEKISAKKITWLSLLVKNQFVTPSVMIKKDIPFRFVEGRRYVDDHLLWLEIVGSGLSAVKLDVCLAAIYKPMYGASGLSSNMWEMEKAELSNYQHLHETGKLSFFLKIILQIFSLLKFLKRLLVVHVFRRMRNLLLK